MESNSLLQRAIAEAIGSAVLVFIGVGSVPATLILSKSSGLNVVDLGLVSFAFMLVIVGLAYSLGQISGCHINPAVTVALAAIRKFPGRDVLPYVLAQFLGAIIGGLAIVGVLGRRASHLGLGIASYASDVSAGRAMFAEALGCAVLAFIVVGVVDRRVAAGWAGLAIGATVFSLVLVIGPATGGAVNPARYLGPMVASLLVGDTVEWSQLPVYFIAEFIGAAIGAAAYIAVGRLAATTRTVTLPDEESVPV